MRMITLYMIVHNPADIRTEINATLEGAPITYKLDPGERRRIAIDGYREESGEVWYDFAQCYPDLPPRPTGSTALTINASPDSERDTGWSEIS
jgi:hypothetical protein